MNKILERLDLLIQRKFTESPNKSHTAKLLKKGPEKCAEKFGESNDNTSISLNFEINYQKGSIFSKLPKI